MMGVLVIMRSITKIIPEKLKKKNSFMVEWGWWPSYQFY